MGRRALRLAGPLPFLSCCAPSSPGSRSRAGRFGQEGRLAEPPKAPLFCGPRNKRRSARGSPLAARVGAAGSSLPSPWDCSLPPSATGAKKANSPPEPVRIGRGLAQAPCLSRPGGGGPAGGPLVSALSQKGHRRLGKSPKGPPESWRGLDGAPSLGGRAEVRGCSLCRGGVGSSRGGPEGGLGNDAGGGEERERELFLLPEYWSSRASNDAESG